MDGWTSSGVSDTELRNCGRDLAEAECLGPNDDVGYHFAASDRCVESHLEPEDLRVWNCL